VRDRGRVRTASDTNSVKSEGIFFIWAGSTTKI